MLRNFSIFCEFLGVADNPPPPRRVFFNRKKGARLCNLLPQYRETRAGLRAASRLSPKIFSLRRALASQIISVLRVSIGYNLFKALLQDQWEALLMLQKLFSIMSAEQKSHAC
jgi:hypothetical protein